MARQLTVRNLSLTQHSAKYVSENVYDISHYNRLCRQQEPFLLIKHAENVHFACFQSSCVI